MGIQVFSVKREGLVNREVFFKKGGVSLIFILTTPFQYYLSLYLRFACVCFSWEEIRLTEFYQPVCDFYKLVVFEKRRHC